MKQELLDLIDEKDKIFALAHEENSFMNIPFVVYDVPEFISMLALSFFSSAPLPDRMWRR